MKQETVLVAEKRKWKSYLNDTSYHYDAYKNIDDFMKSCKKNKIKYLLPLTIKNELFLLKYSSKIMAKGYKFLVPSKKVIEILDNKTKFVDYMIKNKLDEYIPKKYNKIKYPCILKKNVSIFGKDGYIINSASDIPENINIDDYLIQEPINGSCEYSTDILAKNGKIIKVSASRYCYDSELYIMGCKVMSPAINEKITDKVYSAFEKIIRTLNYSGFCNIDYKVVDTGYPKIFEINPRCGGSLRDIPLNKFNKLVAKYTELCN
jgi:carbamoylphosphate synthase large subunit